MFQYSFRVGRIHFVIAVCQGDFCVDSFKTYMNNVHPTLEDFIALIRAADIHLSSTYGSTDGFQNVFILKAGVDMTEKNIEIIYNLIDSQ